MSYIKHLPVESIEHLGEVRTRELPPIEKANGNEPFPVDIDCPDCGSGLDDEKCVSCEYGHEDCTAQGCFACYERAVSKAEDLYD